MKDKGFTLLEVLIALAVVSGLLITLIYSINYQLGIVARQETITIATMLAKKTLSEMEEKPGNVKGNYDPPYEKYAYETIVRESVYPGVNEIVVEVKGNNEEVSLNEYISK